MTGAERDVVLDARQRVLSIRCLIDAVADGMIAGSREHSALMGISELATELADQFETLCEGEGS
jgi:hypothetical protein